MPAADTRRDPVPAAGTAPFGGGLQVAWLDHHLPRFGPWVDDDITPASLQRFAELAIAYDALEGCGAAPEVAARWLGFLATHVGDDAYAELARANLDRAAALLLPYLVIRRHGFVDGYHDETLALAERAGFPTALEVVPYRALDYAYFADRAGRPGRAPVDIGALARRTFAGAARCRCLVDADSAYALTHALFYLSDFGSRPVDPALCPAAPALVDSMIVDASISRSYDLLAELLVGSQVVAGCRQSIREVGDQVLAAAVGPDGSVLPEADATDRTFETCYHTTLVVVLLCASRTTSPTC